MAVGTASYLYAVNINAVADVFINGITNFSLDPGIQQLIAGGDGNIYNTFAGVGVQAPRISFSTTALKMALDKIGIVGLKLNADNKLEAWFQSTLEGGLRGGGSAHIKMVINEGLLVPRTLTATQGPGPALLSYDALATYDGANSPIVTTTSQTLTGTPDTSNLWMLGPVSINGTDLTAIQSVTIDFGIGDIGLSGDGDLFPTFAGINLIQPSIRITTLDMSVLDTFGISGVAQGATDSVIYFRKTTEGGVRVIDATTTHISFSIDDGSIQVRQMGGSDGAPLTAEVSITPTYDGSVTPLVINTATAIT